MPSPAVVHKRRPIDADRNDAQFIFDVNGGHVDLDVVVRGIGGVTRDGQPGIRPACAPADISSAAKPAHANLVEALPGMKQLKG
jgi:hypothetical protein